MLARVLLRHLIQDSSEQFWVSKQPKSPLALLKQGMFLTTDLSKSHSTRSGHTAFPKTKCLFETSTGYDPAWFQCLRISLQLSVGTEGEALNPWKSLEAHLQHNMLLSCTALN